MSKGKKTKLENETKWFFIETVENSKLNDIGLRDVQNNSASFTYFFIQCVSQIWLLANMANVKNPFHDMFDISNLLLGLNN